MCCPREDLERLPLGRDVEAIEINRETRVGESRILARRGTKSNTSPSCEVCIRARRWLNRKGTDVAEWLGIQRIYRPDALLYYVEHDDGLH